jgi:hypothetical protein
MLASFLGVLPILTPPLCALAFIYLSRTLLVIKYPTLRQYETIVIQKTSECLDSSLDSQIIWLVWVFFKTSAAESRLVALVSLSIIHPWLLLGISLISRSLCFKCMTFSPSLFIGNHLKCTIYLFKMSIAVRRERFCFKIYVS